MSFREPGDGGVDFLGMLAGNRLGGGCRRVRSRCFVFASGLLGAAEVFDGKIQGVKQPTRKLLPIVHGMGLLRQTNESDLNGIFSEMAILQLSQCRGENPASMPLHDLTERGLVFLPDKCFEQLLFVTRAVLLHRISLPRFHVRWREIRTHYFDWENGIWPPHAGRSFHLPRSASEG